MPQQELPLYTLRVSTKARRVRLEVTSLGEIRVTIPQRFRPEHVPAFIAEHQPWITRTLHRIHHRQANEPELFTTRPQRVALQAIDRTWDVQYQHHARPGVREAMPASQLMVDIAHSNDAASVLRAWLHQQALAHLIPWLQQTSARLALPFNKVTIRGQTTRWGSCSARKNINLNRALLFLPRELVDYLLIHELCHTQHMNHSARYWSLVQRCDPDYARKERELSSAQRWVPAWAQTPR